MLRLIFWRLFVLLWVAILVVGCSDPTNANGTSTVAVGQPEPMNPPATVSGEDGAEAEEMSRRDRDAGPATEAPGVRRETMDAVHADPSAPRPGDLAPMEQQQAQLKEQLRHMSRDSRNSPDASIGLGVAGGNAQGFAGRPANQPLAGPAPDSEPQGSEQFEDYGENPWTEVEKDALSTFAIDVDTAAYTLMRNDVLEQKRLPAKDSVRVEEYLNYFRYEYAAPQQGGTPFAVHMEAAPSPFTEGRQLVRVGIKGYEVPAEERKAANLVFLIDVSGSMSAANKLPLIKYALKQLVDKLNPKDTLGIVVYAGRQAVLLEPTAVEEKSRILNILDGLRSGGGTAGAAGIKSAYELAHKAFRPDGINRVVLCTDGDFNVGARGEDLVELVGAQREKGISLSTFLFGRGNINDRFMEKISNQGNGNHAFIDSKNEALRALGDNVVGMLQVIAKDVKIQVEFNPQVVKSYRLIGYENRAIADQDFRNDKVDAGELGAGHSVTALYEVEMAAMERSPAADAPALTARLRYKKPGATDDDPAAEIAKVLTFGDFTGNPTFDHASADFRFATAVAWFGQIMKRSENVERSTMDRLIAIAEQTAGDHADRQEFLKIAIQASDMPKLYEPVASAEQPEEQPNE